jgi:hypothetical protein
MKTLISFIFFIELFLVLSGCGFGDWKVDELYAQKIEGTSRLLYKYDASGGRDAHASGYVILDSTETFQVNLSNDLPFMFLQEPPGNTSIKGVSHICDNSCDENYKKALANFFPIKQETTTRQDFRITNITYQYKGYAERSKGLERFHFEKFKETRDTISFYNLDDVESMDGIHLDSLKLKKTDVAVMQNANHNILKIVVEDLVVDKVSKEMILNQTYFLTPKHNLSSKAFSDYGIFKQIVK